MSTESWWLLVGLLGQGLFMMRFVIQWIHSERQRKSVVPLSFWYFSILGGLTLLVYSIYRKDPVFILGQVLGIGIYLRNLALIRSAKTSGANSEAT
ncbi:lipid A biosynthesis-like protein [Paucimonas lemoignei]|uniref:Lipid A biosynthesis-like protein n=1 Tax=Paucimonas lemoignei TaxID=29443 RepID=A0A4R3HVY5_PAULE|nr:lipid-A-disaccharide synthase N-terminal domain-containing protein [Paucimonas lemoignei]TCS37426.1 lipid A biosynthesis-like protein [Paucimonas lemoignei]